jgi:hypothetical protein
MARAEYFITAAGAFAAGLALGPAIRHRTGKIAIGGLVAAALGAALSWAPSLSLLIQVFGPDLLGLSFFALDLLVTILFGIAAVLLPLALGAAITG